MAVFAFALLLIFAVAGAFVPESAVPSLIVAVCCAVVIGKDGGRLLRRLRPQAQAQGRQAALWSNFFCVVRTCVAVDYSITALKSIGNLLALAAVLAVLAAMGAVVILCWAKPTKELVRAPRTSSTS